MDPCYNYIVLENKCYRIDLNTAEIDIYDINENYLAINGVATKDDLIKKLNSINERNCSEDVNAIMFQSPCVNSPGFLYLGSILYRFYGKLTLHSAITRNIPEKLCPPSGDSFLSCLSTFLTNVLRYKLVSRKDRDNIICANTTYELSIDNVCFLFDKYTDFDKSFMSNMFHPNDLLKALRILNTTILSSNRKNINKTLKLCDNGNVVFNDNVFLLRRSKVGGYFLTGNIDMLFSSCNMSLPDGMRRIGIFPEFKSAESLYGFIQDITGLALKRDD